MLDKYLAAAKEIAAHAVLLPQGFRFSEKITRPDWTEEILGQIKAVYLRYSIPAQRTHVKLQGLVWDSKGGGVIPLESYLEAALADAIGGPRERTWQQLLRNIIKSARYLQTLCDTLAAPTPLRSCSTASASAGVRPRPETSPRAGCRDSPLARGVSHGSAVSAITNRGSSRSIHWSSRRCSGSSWFLLRIPRRLCCGLSQSASASASPGTSWSGKNRGWNRRAIRLFSSATWVKG